MLIKKWLALPTAVCVLVVISSPVCFAQGGLLGAPDGTAGAAGGLGGALSGAINNAGNAMSPGSTTGTVYNGHTIARHSSNRRRITHQVVHAHHAASGLRPVHRVKHHK